MSDKKQDSRKHSAVLSTIAAVGIGAIAAAGAFFVGKALGEEETEARLKAQEHYQQQRQQQQQFQQQQRRAPTQTRVTDQHSAELTEDEDEVDPKQAQAGGLEHECIICMSDFEELKRRDIEIHTTPCGHLFCGACISRCLQRKNECPTCKQVVLPGQTLRVFL